MPRVGLTASCGRGRSRNWIATAARAAMVLVVAAVASRFVRAAEPALDWEPQRTWVFAAGLLEWDRPDLLAGFPAARKNRSDGQLIRLFRDSGVPDGQIVFLKDAAATKARIGRELRALLDRTRPGDLLIVYYFYCPKLATLIYP